jgi:threonine dehydrogenase-like Zn-dependent dehydrogenase
LSATTTQPYHPTQTGHRDTMMKALFVEAGKATLRETPKPAPAAGEVLIKVRLAGICSTDLEIIRGYAGFSGIIGHEFVGTVIHGSASLLNKRVVGEINCVCGKCDMCTSGLSNHCRRRTVVGISGRPGAFAEFIALPERNCVEVPAALSDEEAVFTEPLAAAFQILRQVKIEPRMNVAVLGTGRLGLLVSQVLSTTGCKLVAVGRNPLTLGLLDRRGIRTAELTSIRQMQECDIVIDCTGSGDGLNAALQLVRPRGTIVMKTTTHAPSAADLSALVVNEITMLGSRCGSFGDALNALARRQIEVKSLVTRTMPFDQALAALELASQPDQIKVLLQMTA